MITKKFSISAYKQGKKVYTKSGRRVIIDNIQEPINVYDYPIEGSIIIDGEELHNIYWTRKGKHYGYKDSKFDLVIKE